jgi:hypothetical protein
MNHESIFLLFLRIDFARISLIMDMLSLYWGYITIGSSEKFIVTVGYPGEDVIIRKASVEGYFEPCSPITILPISR